jgi:hypothetical protein
LRLNRRESIEAQVTSLFSGDPEFKERSSRAFAAFLLSNRFSGIFEVILDRSGQLLELFEKVFGAQVT